jgi:hypothetical protein
VKDVGTSKGRIKKVVTKRYTGQETTQIEAKLEKNTPVDGNRCRVEHSLNVHPEDEGK